MLTIVWKCGQILLKIELVENYSCNSRSQLSKREGEIIRSTECVNKRIEGRTTSEYIKDTTESRKLKRLDNLEHYKQRDHEYYIKNSEQIKEKARLYLQENASTINERRRQLRLINRDHINQRQKEYRDKHKDELNARRRKVAKDIK